MDNRALEICCYTVESAIVAAQNGADRIELCDNYPEGGTTPSFGSIVLAQEQVDVAVNVIVRPRGGDFLYSDIEFDTICKDIELVKDLGCNGIVVGFLNADGSVDFRKMEQVMALADAMEVTFHRAIDMANNPMESIQRLSAMGVNRVLTSGCTNTASDGVAMIKKMVEAANGEIIIMPGSGVNEQNIDNIMQLTGAVEFHSSAKTFEPTAMQYFNRMIHMGEELDEYSKITVNAESIRRMSEILHQ